MLAYEQRLFRGHSCRVLNGPNRLSLAGPRPPYADEFMERDFGRLLVRGVHAAVTADFPEYRTLLCPC
jgi:hypothetical protein